MRTCQKEFLRKTVLEEVEGNLEKVAMEVHVREKERTSNILSCKLHNRLWSLDTEQDKRPEFLICSECEEDFMIIQNDLILTEKVMGNERDPSAIKYYRSLGTGSPEDTGA